MKKCFKCQCEKPRSDFYAHKMMADGLLGKCKECTKADVHARRHGDGREAVLAYDIERSKRPERAAALQAIARRNAKLRPERNRAHQRVRYAIETGRLTPWPVCAVPECCGSPEAHHSDYSRPLDVVWLCVAHHRQAHALVPGYYSKKPF